MMRDKSQTSLPPLGHHVPVAGGIPDVRRETRRDEGQGMISKNSSLRRSGAARARVSLRGPTLCIILAGALMLQGDVRAGAGQGRDTRPTRTIRVQGIKVSLEEIRHLEEKLAKDRPAGGQAELMSVPPEEEPGPLSDPGTT